MAKSQVIYHESDSSKVFDMSKEEISKLKAWLKQRMERMKNGH